MRKRILEFFILSFLACTFSCATPKANRHESNNIYRFVSNNIFYSTSDPSVEIAVNPEFKYLGQVKKTRTIRYKRGSGKGSVEDISFIFVKAGENKKLEECIIIAISTIEQGYILPNLFAGIESYLDAGYVKISGINYQYNIHALPMALIDRYEVGFIVGKGYKIPECLVIKGLGRRIEPDNKTKIHIFYFEDANFDKDNKYVCEDWDKANLLTEEQKIYLRKFVDRSNADIKITGSFALQDRLKAFLFNYCRAYKERQLDKFSTFFAPDAIEKGKPFSSRLAQYRRNFEKIDSMDYRIELENHSVNDDTGIIRIDGTFHTRNRLSDSGKWERNSGEISMDLVVSGDSFKVKRLDFFNQPDQEVALGTQQEVKPESSIREHSTHEYFQDRLKVFLSDYCRAYENKQLDKFAAFFAADAVEKGKSFRSILPEYRRNFKKIDSMDYRIELMRHSVQKDTGLIRIEGTFHVRARPSDSKEWRQNSGEISMDLIASGDSFKVWRLDYFSQAGQEIASKTSRK